MNLLDTEQSGQRHASEPPRKLPVLFHLIDVSRQRATRPPAEAPPHTAAESTLAAAIAAEPPGLELTSAPAEFHSFASPAPVHSLELHQSPALVAEAVAETPAAVEATPVVTEPITNELTAQTPPDEATSPPTPRPEAQRPLPERRRKPKTPLTEDWFVAHGKYIALLFVLALGGTIYLARVNRRTPPVADNGPLQLEIDTSKSAAATPALKPAARVNADSSANSASPAKLTDTASGGAPQAELFPPTTPPQLASAETPAFKPASGGLFPASATIEKTAEKADQRLATRPSGPTEIVNHTLNAPPTTPPAPSAPAAEPSYPTTGYPPTGLPAANYPTTNPQMPAYPTTGSPPAMPQFAPPTMPQHPPGFQPPQFQPPQFQPAQYQPPSNPPAQYPPYQSAPAPSTQYQPTQYQPQSPPGPASDYRSAYSPAAPPQQAWPPMPPGGTAPNSPVTTATGTRYERTGSSLYQGLR